MNVTAVHNRGGLCVLMTHRLDDVSGGDIAFFQMGCFVWGIIGSLFFIGFGALELMLLVLNGSRLGLLPYSSQELLGTFPNGAARTAYVNSISPSHADFLFFFHGCSAWGSLAFLFYSLGNPGADIRCSEWCVIQSSFLVLVGALEQISGQHM